MYVHQAPRILLCILEAACNNVPTGTVTSMLLVVVFHSHSHNIVAVSSSSAPFLAHCNLSPRQFTRLSAGFPATVFSHLCCISGLVDEARMGGGGGGGVVSNEFGFEPIY